MSKAEALFPLKIVAFAADIIRNTSLFLFAQISSRIIGFIYMLYLAASLPTESFGALSIALTILIVADTISDIGLSKLTVRTLSRDPGLAGEYPSRIIPFRIILSIIVFAVCVAGVQASDHGQEVTLFIVIIGAGLIVTGISSILESVLQSRSSFGYIGLAHVGLSIVQAGAGFCVVSSGGSIAALATTFLVSNITFLVLLLIGIFRRQPLGRLRIDPAFWLSQARLSLPYAGTAIMMIISMRCELLIMSSVSSAEQVAFFSVAARLNDAAILAPMVLATVLVPQYSRHHSETPGVLTRSYSAVLRWGLLIAIPVAMVAALLIGPVILALLPAYGSSAQLAAIMFSTMPLFAIYQLNFAVFLSSDVQGRTMMTLAGLLLVQLVFGFVLIPPYAADGAAMSYALWTLAAAVVSTGLAKHWYMKDLCVSRVVAPAVIGGLAMGAVLWMIWDAHWAIRLATAIVSYSAATIAVLRMQGRSTARAATVVSAD